MGTFKRWKAEQVYRFVGRAIGDEDACFHKITFASNNEPNAGQGFLFVFEEGPTGAAAVKVNDTACWGDKSTNSSLED